MTADALFYTLGLFLLAIGVAGQGAYWFTLPHQRRHIRAAGLFTGVILLWAIAGLIVGPQPRS